MSAPVANSETRSPERRVRCPRCGYDQRGVIETWKETCPLDGTCSECGLQFEWAHLFNPLLFPPRWCVEYGRWWSVAWRCVATIATSFMPWRFWRTLQMHHQPRWRRVVAYLLSLMAIVYLAFLAELGATAYQNWRGYETNISRLRGWGRSLTPAQVQQFAARQGVSPGAYIPFRQVSMVKAVGFALLTPFSNQPIGYTLYPDGTQQSYATPRQNLQSRFDMSKTEWLIRRRSLGPTMVFPWLFALLVPLAFVFLPMTRRVSRVRWHHIVRIALYGVLWLALACAWLIHRMPEDALYKDRWGEFAFVAFIVTPMALTLWWGFAISRHLRIRSPWMTTLSLATIAYLLPMLCGYFWVIVDQRPDWFMPG